ncbi:hypothetical protein T484DRAFT_1756350 [Baffinella frigidus]|nr:hypothetical protein T484DRAFT_1756350 [Cryptophyta sp. CCMP2293]
MGPATIPTNDPNRSSIGGGSYTGTAQTPSTEDFEDLFGPAGRDVKQDPQRHKRHQRWHLPDVLKGTNSFLTDRVDGLISNATDSPFTSMVLPYQYVDNPDQAMSWDVWSYDEGLASRVPYESAARVLTQSKTSHSAYIVRQGLAISMEHNFMMSERGRRDFNNQLMQLVGSIQYTNDLDVHMALLTAPNYERTEAEKYAYSEADPYAVLRKYVDMHGMCQKNPNGLDILIEDAKQVFKRWGASEPTFMLCNPKIGYQQNMTVEKTQYLTNGVDGIKRLKAGPELKSYRGLNVINSRHFSMEAGRQPRDLLNRRVRVAEHYKLPAMTAVEMDQSEMIVYDEGKDQMVAISCEDLYDAAMLPGDQSFKNIVGLERDQKNIPVAFWNHFFYSAEDATQPMEVAKTQFMNWLQTPPTRGTNDAAYHPEFVVKFYAYFGITDSTDPTKWDFGSVMGTKTPDTTPVSLIPIATYVSLMSHIFGMTADDRTRMTLWLKFVRGHHAPSQRIPTTYGNCHNSCRLPSDFPDDTVVPSYPNIYQMVFVGSFKFTDREGNEVGQTREDEASALLAVGEDRHDTAHKIDWMSIAYSQMLPYISDVYSRCHNLDGLFSGGNATARPTKHTLIAVRPSIEHQMLGVIVGRGGTGELGATLWGQTELSCYDDAMHGKWGMNYKYHARAVVFNEKHLLRLWDVAYNGYTGGMGTKLVKWDDKSPEYREWKKTSMSLDEPLRYDFADMFVMRFVQDKGFDSNVSNPISFHTPPEARIEVYSDPENINSLNSEPMDVFNAFTTVGNKGRYDKYVELMPNYAGMHSGRKNAGHSAHEGDTHVASLSYSGTMQVRNKTNNVTSVQQSGTGHCGDSFVGSASIRAGNGSMTSGRPALGRLM